MLQAYHQESYANLRTAMRNTNQLCGIMLNLAGANDVHVTNRAEGSIALQQVRSWPQHSLQLLMCRGCLCPLA